MDWREDYSIGVQRLDNHHKRLFEAANRLFSAVENGKTPDEVVDILEFLLGYASFHFGEEEAVLARYGYPQLEAHRADHRRLIEQAEGLRERVHGGEIEVGSELSRLVREWLVRHILDEDRRFASFLNEKGVY
jgi:hemerythrin